MSIKEIYLCLKENLPKHWAKYLHEIAVNLHFVNNGIKNAFLWDIGPNIDSIVLNSLIGKLKEATFLNKYVKLLSIENDLCIANGEKYHQIRFEDIIFVDVTKTQHEPIKLNMLPNQLQKMFTDINFELKNFFNSEEDYLVLSIRQDFCVPSIFGILLGYPIVYWYDNLKSPEHCLNDTFLICIQLIFNGITLIAFSCPKHIYKADENTRLKIAMWNKPFKDKRFEVKYSEKSVNMINL